MNNITIETVTHERIETGVVEYVDPQEVVIDENVRTIGTVDAVLLASVKENGVRTPLRGFRNDKGQVVIEAGQRRTLAAREAGLTTIPVYVVPAPATRAARIVDQVIENDHRAELTDRDRVAAFKQLSLDGLDVPEIAKKLVIAEATVEKGLAVAKNKNTAAILAEHQLTLDQSAILLEFTGDDRVIAGLIDVAIANPNRFAHAAQQERDEKLRREFRASASKSLKKYGYELLSHEPWERRELIGLARLEVIATGEPATLDQIKTVDGRVAYIKGWAKQFSDVAYYIPRKAARTLGMRDRDAARPAGGMSEDEKAERRIVIANNKAWDSAETVRREWLASFLSKKVLPKDAGRFVAAVLVGRTSQIDYEATALAAALTGVKDRAALAKLADSPTKAGHAAFAVAICAFEAHTSRSTWRYQVAEYRGYVQKLAQWGYALSEVEQIVAGKLDEE